MNKYTRKSDKLRNECIDALYDKFFETRTSKWCSSPAFQLPDGMFDNYNEIVFLSPLYVYDNKGVAYSIYEIPLQQLCEMTDSVIDR